MRTRLGMGAMTDTAELRTFDVLFAEHNLTPEERTKLVWHLAAFRARRTVETLLGQDYDGGSVP